VTLYHRAVIHPLLGARLHGILDDVVVALYLLGVWALKLRGIPLGIAIAAAVVHFVNARITDYPQGTFRRIPFTTHASLELAEGLVVLCAAWTLVPRELLAGRVFLTIMGLGQVGAYLISDYEWPKKDAKPSPKSPRA
jgi:hypothetical protein